MDATPPPPPPSAPEEPPARDWSLLPLDVLASVFVRLGAFEVLKGAGLVCRSWLDAAKVPDVWRVVDMKYQWLLNSTDESADLRAMTMAAVDRSHGQLRVFSGSSFVTAELTQYIVERSPSLTSLQLVSSFSNVLSAITESPLRELRFLELNEVGLTMEELIAVLDNCPLLELLTVRACPGMDEEDGQVLREKYARIKTMTYRSNDVFCFDDWVVQL